jgi:membrane-associated protein
MMQKVPWNAIGGIVAVLLALGTIGILLMAVTDDAMGTLEDPSSDAAAYALVFLFVYGDAIVAVFPGETTLNVASTLASQDELELSLVIVVGAVAAWLGDNTLYWVARSIPAVRERARQAQEDERFKEGLRLIGRHSQILVMFCRFLPFVRWAVMAGMGALPMPYRSFAASTAIGAVAWSAYTCIVAYAIGTALDEFPLASIVIACASSAAIVGAVFFLERKRFRSSAGENPGGT